MDMMGIIAGIDLLRREEVRRQRAFQSFQNFQNAMEKKRERNRKRLKIDDAFYDLGFQKVPYRSGRVPDGAVAYEPLKGKALVFGSYHEAEEWLKKAGVWKA